MVVGIQVLWCAHEEENHSQVWWIITTNEYQPVKRSVEIVMWSICLVIVFMRDAYLYHVKVNSCLPFHFYRYIQGARFFDNPNIAFETLIPNHNDQNLSQTAVINSESPARSTTLRARFVGQGYKQVHRLNHDLIGSIPNASSLTGINVNDVSLCIFSTASIHK